MDFHIVLLEGAFHYDPDRGLYVDMAGERRYVLEALEPLFDQQIQIALHHTPPMPPDPSKWGGGCCLWQNYDSTNSLQGMCPVGHHVQPHALFSFVGEGVLRRAGEEGGWPTLEKFDGSKPSTCLGHLNGHLGRLASSPSLDVEKMRDSLADTGLLDQIETLGVQGQNLQDILARLQKSEK